MKGRFRLVLLLALVLLLSGCGKGDANDFTRAVKEDQLNKNYGTPAFVNAVTAPSEGDDPLSLTGVENVLRIGYVLQHAENYAVRGAGTVKTKVAFISYTQEVESYKDFARGAMVQIDVTKSSIVSDAWETCYVGDVAMIRGAAGGRSTWDGRNTEWVGDDPEIFSRDDYRREYGLFGVELSNYILNEETVDDWSPVTDNGDGTYTVTIYPNLTAATGDCVRRMKKMGGLEKDPVFKESAITLTFDGSFRLLSMHIEEVYSVKIGIINSDNCRASTDYVYSYGNADITDFDGYFAWYLEE